MLQHPRFLLWYVSGQLDPAENIRIETHLSLCAECGLEAGHLASMMKSLRQQTQIDHVAAADLTLYEEGMLAPRGGRSGAVKDHLDECGSCREDLRTLGRARRLESVTLPEAVRSAGGSNRWGWTFAAAAAALIVVASSLPAPYSQPSLETGARQIASVVFPAERRGIVAGSTLRGSGPWAIRVVLSYGSPPGDYRVTVQRRGGAPLRGLETIASADGESLTMLLDDLPGLGRYEMTVQSLSAGDDPPQIYQFELLSAAGKGPVL